MTKLIKVFDVIKKVKFLQKVADKINTALPKRKKPPVKKDDK